MCEPEYICPECGEPCEAIACDSGIGPYEFWGAKYNQSIPYMGSSCCEAELDDVSYPDPDERGDYEYECRRDAMMERD